MIIGEWKKIIRNKIFLMISCIILAINALTIFYLCDVKDKAYVEYLNEKQEIYLNEYDSFISGFEDRADSLKNAYGGNASNYYKRNADKMLKDYADFSDVEIDSTFNVGFYEYANYNYGIWFIMAFGFILYNFVFLKDKKTGMMFILRASKNGREKLIRCKWLCYILLTVVFTVLQELITILCINAIYTFGNTGASIQSLFTLRDCVFHFTINEGLIFTLGWRLLIAVTIASLLFLVGMVPTIIIIALQFVIYLVLDVNSRYANLFCLNTYSSWDINKLFGEYYNFNFFEYPISKLVIVSITFCLIIILSVTLGAHFMSVRYRYKLRLYGEKIVNYIRSLFSKLLHIRNLFINEIYKVFFAQKKGLLIIIYCVIVITSIKAYLPENKYQTYYEATYHMYISNIEGEVDETAKKYINDEIEYLNSLEDILASRENGEVDEITLMQVQSEYDGRKEAFDRLMEQYNLLENKNEKVYFIDELNFKKLITKYDRDIVLFFLSALLLIINISAIFASRKERNIYSLVYSTKNGRKVLSRNKYILSFSVVIIIFAIYQIPTILGYKSTLGNSAYLQKLENIYDPSINCSLSIFMLGILLLLVRLFLIILISSTTIIAARKTNDEFITTTAMSVVLVIGCLIMYFCKLNITGIIVNIIGG